MAARAHRRHRRWIETGGAATRGLLLDRLVFWRTQPGLSGRLNISLEPGAALLSVREPMVLNPRARRALERDALVAQLSGEERTPFIERSRRGGTLPSGMPGVLAAQQAWTRVTPVIKHLAPLLDYESCQTVAIETVLEGWRLHGLLENVGPNGQILWSVDALSPWVMLRAWCAHLLLNTDSGAPSHETHLVDAIGVIRFPAQEDAVETLGRLMEVYREGLLAGGVFSKKRLGLCVGNEKSTRQGAKNLDGIGVCSISARVCRSVFRFGIS